MFFEMFFVQDETCCRFPGNVDIHVTIMTLVFLAAIFGLWPRKKSRNARRGGERRSCTRGWACIRVGGAVPHHGGGLGLALYERSIVLAGATKGSSPSHAAAPPRRHHHLGQGPLRLRGQCEGGIDHPARAPEQGAQRDLVGWV